MISRTLLTAAFLLATAQISGRANAANSSSDLRTIVQLEPGKHFVYCYGNRVTGALELSVIDDTLVANGFKPRSVPTSTLQRSGLLRQVEREDSGALSRELARASAMYDSLLDAGIGPPDAAALAITTVDTLLYDPMFEPEFSEGAVAIKSKESGSITLHVTLPLSVRPGQLPDSRAQAVARMNRVADALRSDRSVLLLLSRSGLFFASDDARIPRWVAEISGIAHDAQAGVLDWYSLRFRDLPYAAILEIAEVYSGVP